MSKSLININNSHVCAFCKFWWDPTYKHISPSNNIHWEFDSSARCHCIKKHVETLATATCGKFKIKIELD